MDDNQSLRGIAPTRPLPTGRPQAFVADPSTVDTPHLRGIWIDPTGSYADLHRVLASEWLNGCFVIVDQVNFGPCMLDEFLDLQELRDAAMEALVFGQW